MAEFKSTAENISSLPLHEQFLEILKRVKKNTIVIAILISVILIAVLEFINFGCLVAGNTNVSSSTGHSAWAEAEDQSEADVQEEKKNNSEQSGISKSLFMDDFGSEKEIGQEEEINAEEITDEDSSQIAQSSLDELFDGISTICVFCGFFLLMISAARFAFAFMNENPDDFGAAIQGVVVAVFLLGARFVICSI